MLRGVSSGNSGGSSGVSSLQAKTGDITLTSSGGTVTITTPTSSTINLETASGGGTVTTTGSPTSGNLTKFSGGTSITNGDLSGDITTSGTLVTTVAKIAGTTVSGTTGSGNVVFSTSPTLVSPILGTPTSVTLTNATGLPISTGVSGLAAGIATFLATPSSANLATAVTDETGTGALVFATSPTLTTAVLGSSTATTQTPADNSTKVATTAYVDNAVLGQRQKEAVKYASTAALPSIVYSNGSSGVGATLTGVALAAISLDSSSPSVNDRVLIKNQASTFQNGIYTVTATGSGIAVFVLTRATDFDQSSDIQTGDMVFVTAGSTLANTTWAYNGIDSPTMGTTALTFVQAAGPGSYTAGNGITITGTSIAIDTAVTVDKTTAQTLTNKTLTAPVISTISNTGTVTLFTATDTVVGRATTDTLTNKRITKRLVTVNAPGATPTTNTDNCDIAAFTGLAANITSMTTNLSGTPIAAVDFLEVQFTDNGTARTITWGASFAATTVALPTTTVISTLLRVLFQRNTAGTAWDCIAVA